MAVHQFRAIRYLGRLLFLMTSLFPPTVVAMWPVILLLWILAIGMSRDWVYRHLLRRSVNVLSPLLYLAALLAINFWVMPYIS